jgi:hypothetical protein
MVARRPPKAKVLGSSPSAVVVNGSLFFGLLLQMGEDVGRGNLRKLIFVVMLLLIVAVCLISNFLQHSESFCSRNKPIHLTSFQFHSIGDIGGFTLDRGVGEGQSCIATSYPGVRCINFVPMGIVVHGAWV